LHAYRTLATVFKCRTVVQEIAFKKVYSTYNNVEDHWRSLETIGLISLLISRL